MVNLDINLIRKMYCEDCMSSNKIAEHFGVSQGTILGRLKRANVEMRTLKDYPTWKPHEEWKTRISQTLKEKIKTGQIKTDHLFQKRHIPYMKGKHHMEESTKKMSESKKGKSRKPHTEETKQKISQTRNERIKSGLITIKGHINKNKGVPMPEEQKKKISDTLKKLKRKEIDVELMKKMYSEDFQTIDKIAKFFGVSYAILGKKLKEAGMKIRSRKDYHFILSEEHKKKISHTLKEKIQTKQMKTEQLFQKGCVSQNKGIPMPEEQKKRISEIIRRGIKEGKIKKGYVPPKGNVPANKLKLDNELIRKIYYEDKLPIKNICKILGVSNNVIRIRLKEIGLPIKTREDYPRMMSEETKGKIIPKLHAARDEWYKNLTPEKAKEHFRKILRRRGKSKLEEKFENVINKFNLPYKYVGDGSIVIGKRAREIGRYKIPDFVNTSGEKILVEVYYKKHKEKIGQAKGRTIDDYKKEKNDHYAEYGYKTEFFDETQVNENEILKRLRSIEIESQ